MWVESAEVVAQESSPCRRPVSWPAARDDDVGRTTRRLHHRAVAPGALQAVIVRFKLRTTGSCLLSPPHPEPSTPETLRLLYDFERLKTDPAGQHAVANSMRSLLTPEQLCQRRGATFARLRMLQGSLGSQPAPYASSLLPRSRARAPCGVGAFAPAPVARVLASR